MAKLKVEVLDAIVDGKQKGEQLEIDQKAAEHLAGIGYVKILKTVPAAEPKKAAEKKAPAKK